MRNRNGIMWLIFLLSGAALVISLKLFWNMGIYVDEAGTSPSVVYGSDFWLYMAWLRLFLLTGVVMASGISLLKKR